MFGFYASYKYISSRVGELFCKNDDYMRIMQCLQTNLELFTLLSPSKYERQRFCHVCTSANHRRNKGYGYWKPHGIYQARCLIQSIPHRVTIHQGMVEFLCTERGIVKVDFQYQVLIKFSLQREGCCQSRLSI